MKLIAKCLTIRDAEVAASQHLGTKLGSYTIHFNFGWYEVYYHD